MAFQIKKAILCFLSFLFFSSFYCLFAEKINYEEVITHCIENPNADIDKLTILLNPVYTQDFWERPEVLIKLKALYETKGQFSLVSSIILARIYTYAENHLNQLKSASLNLKDKDINLTSYKNIKKDELISSLKNLVYSRDLKIIHFGLIEILRLDNSSALLVAEDLFKKSKDTEIQKLVIDIISEVDSKYQEIFIKKISPLHDKKIEQYAYSKLKWQVNATFSDTLKKEMSSEVLTSLTKYREDITNFDEFLSITLTKTIFFTFARKPKKIYFFNPSIYIHHFDFIVKEKFISDINEHDFYDESSEAQFINGIIFYDENEKAFFIDYFGSSKNLFHGELVQSLPSYFKRAKPQTKIKNLIEFSYNVEKNVNDKIQYDFVNEGSSLGRFSIIRNLNEIIKYSSTDIHLYPKLPDRYYDIGGIIIGDSFSRALHSSVLLFNSNIPAANLSGAEALLKAFDGCFIYLEVNEFRLQVRIAKSSDYQGARENQNDIVKVSAITNVRKISTLTEQREHDFVYFGAKSANLGEIINHNSKIKVPPGITLSFAYYNDFIEENNLKKYIEDTLLALEFNVNIKHIENKLAQLREKIIKGNFSETIKNEILSKVKSSFGVKWSLFARSSTNVEDLDFYSGAGLYDSYANLKNEEQLLLAIKKVWASLYNDRAYFSRRSFKIVEHSVFPAVLLQLGLDSDVSGVLFTKTHRKELPQECVYIAAKKGLGFKVVSGLKKPEEIIYCSQTDFLEKTRSEESHQLKFNPVGGLQELPVKAENSLLLKSQIQELFSAGQEIEKIFHGRAQDIEWLLKDNQLWIVQSRGLISSGDTSLKSTPFNALEQVICKAITEKNLGACMAIKNADRSACENQSAKILYLSDVLSKDFKSANYFCESFLKRFDLNVAGYLNQSNNSLFCSNLTTIMDQRNCQECHILSGTFYQIKLKLTIEEYIEKIKDPDILGIKFLKSAQNKWLEGLNISIIKAMKSQNIDDCEKNKVCEAFIKKDSTICPK